MRIALTVDPEIPVPPVHYGGIERIVDMLACGLVSRGHEVTVFAHPASSTAGRLVPWIGLRSGAPADTIRNAGALAGYALGRKFDLIHSFSRIAYLAPLLPCRMPKLMTYQRAITRRSVRLGHALSCGSLWFSAISRQMMRGVDDIGTWRLVYNGVPIGSYDFKERLAPNAPLVFLGRVEEIKGPQLAIQVARRTGLPLVIAGNVPQEHKEWFATKIAPQLGADITYIGPINNKEKNELLGRACALLMPIQWEEPFGIVMAEAMACGTPVIGLARGAVAEVIEHDVTGFICDDIDQMVLAVGNLNRIEREKCRFRAEQMFSDRAIVAAYENVYTEMLVESHRRGN